MRRELTKSVFHFDMLNVYREKVLSLIPPNRIHKITLEFNYCLHCEFLIEIYEFTNTSYLNPFSNNSRFQFFRFHLHKRCLRNQYYLEVCFSSTRRIMADGNRNCGQKRLLCNNDHEQNHWASIVISCHH